MRYCIYCEEAMHSSNESVWISGVNFDCHKKCKDEEVRDKVLKNATDGTKEFIDKELNS